MKKLFVYFFTLSLICSCGSGSSDTASQSAESETPAAESKPNMAPAENAVPSMSPSKYIITPFDPSTAYEDAKLSEMSLKDGKWSFKVEGTNYKLGEQTPDAEKKMCANSGKGQHIHLIVDNEPYNARYTSEFSDVELKDGKHIVLAFLSRSYHESIKTKDAYVAETIGVEAGSITRSRPIKDVPMLFYSRPKGTYVGKANTDKVMLDFYLVNATLGDEYRVKATINEEVFFLTTWQPYYIEGLPMGKNKITLTLVDKDGNAVDTPLNPVTREFELKADELEQ